MRLEKIRRLSKELNLAELRWKKELTRTRSKKSGALWAPLTRHARDFLFSSSAGLSFCCFSFFCCHKHHLPQRYFTLWLINISCQVCQSVAIKTFCRLVCSQYLPRKVCRQGRMYLQLEIRVYIRWLRQEFHQRRRLLLPQDRYLLNINSTGILPAFC